jgi:cytochrome c-type biogenesis protein CcmH/NrfF
MEFSFLVLALVTTLYIFMLVVKEIFAVPKRHARNHNMAFQIACLSMCHNNSLDSSVPALARPRSNCTGKLQTHLLVREGASYQETRNCQTEKNNLVMDRRWELDTKTDWPTDRRS